MIEDGDDVILWPFDAAVRQVGSMETTTEFESRRFANAVKEASETPRKFPTCRPITAPLFGRSWSRCRAHHSRDDFGMLP
jgi:hypothetical protein